MKYSLIYYRKNGEESQGAKKGIKTNKARKYPRKRLTQKERRIK
jgi:hypothetical protein